ncbi:MAG: FAD binding domain-containing protein [Brevefilum sp.]
MNMWQNYILAESVEHAVSALAEWGEGGRIIAGGTDLILEIERNVRPKVKTIIDITKIPSLEEIWEDENGVIHIGPLVTHHHVVASDLIREKAFVLTQASWGVGSPQLRNRGTVVGNLVTASPANDTISPLMALDAMLVLLSKRGERIVPLSDFYTGVRKTVMEPDELVTDIFFDAPGPDIRSYFTRIILRKTVAISVTNASVVLRLDGDKVRDVCITLGAAAPTIIHAEAAEDYLEGKALTEETIAEAGRLAVDATRPISDLRGSAEFRRYMIGVLVTRGLTAIRDGIDKDEVPPEPVMLMGEGAKTEPTNEPWTGEEIHTWINGQEYRFKTGFDKTLLNLIREEAGLVGTKEGCAEGECGACTVYLDGRAVNSCLVPAARAHGSQIVTIEGLSSEERIHPVQESFVKYGAIQCGFCTPGFVMSAAKLLEEREDPTLEDIQTAVSGNLCRCTGYYKIIEAIEKASEMMRSTSGEQES